MNFIKVTLFATLAAFAGCAMTDDDQGKPNEGSDVAASPDHEVSVPQALSVSPAATCSGTEQACDTAFVCHHGDGTAIGTRNCPSGKICCQF